jgi:hypothetical protein
VLIAAPATSRPAARAQVGACRIEGPAGSELLVESLAREAAHLLAVVQHELGVTPAAPYRVVLVPPAARWTPGTPPLDSTLNRLDAEVPPWAAGWTMPRRRLIVIRVAESSRYPYGTVESVFAHEVSHQLVHDALGETIPRWLDEGLATWQGRRWSVVDAFALSASMMLRPLPPLGAADSLFLGSAEDARSAYAQAFTFTAWSVRRYGAEFPARLVRELRTRPLAAAWARAAGESFGAAEARWRRSAAVRFRWLPWLGTSGVVWALLSLLAALGGARRRQLQLEQRRRMSDDPWHPDDPLAPGARPGDEPEPRGAPEATIEPPDRPPPRAF